MLNFRIVPINYLSQTMLRTWAPKDWPTVNHDLNPWADPFIDRLNLLIYNLKRQAWVRSPEVVDYFFQRFTWQYQAQIMAEHEYYMDQIERFINIRRAYVWDFYLSHDVDSFMDMKSNGDWAKGYATPEPDELPYFYLDQSIYRDVLESFEWKCNAFWGSVLNQFKEREGKHKQLESSRYSGIAKMTASPLVPWESIIHDHFNHLLFEFAQAARTENLLEGIAAKQRGFLRNGSIPLPNRHTILGWYALCGLDFFPCESNRKDKEHWLSYILPCLPMTLEHNVGNTIPGDDSDSDHSLGYKSSAHDRTAYGRIRHGRWECDNVLLLDSHGAGGNATPYLVARREIRHGGLTGGELVNQSINMLPYVKPGKRQPWSHVRGPIADPNLASYHPIQMTRLSETFDVGFRSLSKWHRIHMQFTDDEMGALAATEWRQAFESELMRFIHLNQTEVLQTIFDACLIRQQVKPTESKAKPGRKPRTDFGFGDWDL